MCSGFCLRFLFALFPAYVSCLGSYEGNMPTTNLQRVQAHTFPDMGPEVKQVGSVMNQPRTQDNHRRYQKEGFFVGSSVKSDSKDCQTSDNQGNMITKPFTSVPNYNLLGFGRPSQQSGAATDIFKNVQSVSQLDYTASQGGSTLMKTQNVLGSKTFKPSRGVSSYEARKSLSSKIFAVQAPEHVYDHVFKPQISRNALVGGPNQAQSNSISSQYSKQHGVSQRIQSFGKFQAAGSTHGPILTGAPVYSRSIPKKTSNLGLTQAEAKTSVVSSGPIFILQGSESSQGLGSTLPNSVKPLGVPSNVDFNQFLTAQSSQTSSVPLNVGSQSSNGVKSWNEPLNSLMRGGQSSAGPKPPKQAGIDCRDDVGKYLVASSGEIRFRAVESGKPVPHYESREEVRHTKRFQKTYNTRSPSQSGYPVFSVSGSKLTEVKPMHLTQSGAQHNVVKSSIASSGKIRMMSVPANVQSKMQSIKLQVTSKPNSRSPDHRVMFPSSQNALQYQPFEASQTSRNVPPTTGTSYKPGSVPSNSFEPSTADSDKINAVHVRLNKWPKSSFGNLQNQWASGNNVGALTVNSGALRSVLPSSNLGQRQKQNVQTPVRSQVPLYHGSKNIQSQSAGIQENYITTISDEFGKGLIRRLSTISSSFRPVLQNQARGVDSSAPGCEVTQNHPSRVGQQGPVKYTSSSSNSQRHL